MHQHSFKCIFLGYSESSKAYRLYDEVNNKFIITCDVIFCEISKSSKNIECQLNDTLFEGNPTYLASPLMDSHVESFPQTSPSMNEQEGNLSNEAHEIVEPLATIETSSIFRATKIFS